MDVYSEKSDDRAEGLYIDRCFSMKCIDYRYILIIRNSGNARVLNGNLFYLK